MLVLALLVVLTGCDGGEDGGAASEETQPWRPPAEAPTVNWGVVGGTASTPEAYTGEVPTGFVATAQATHPDYPGCTYALESRTATNDCEGCGYRFRDIVATPVGSPELRCDTFEVNWGGDAERWDVEFVYLENYVYSYGYDYDLGPIWSLRGYEASTRIDVYGTVFTSDPSQEQLRFWTSEWPPSNASISWDNTGFTIRGVTYADYAYESSGVAHQCADLMNEVPYTASLATERVQATVGDGEDRLVGLSLNAGDSVLVSAVAPADGDAPSVYVVRPDGCIASWIREVSDCAEGTRCRTGAFTANTTGTWRNVST